MNTNIHVMDIFKVSLQGVLGGGTTIDHDIATILFGGHLKVVGNASVVSKVMT